MKDNLFYIFDIRLKQKDLDLSKYKINGCSEFLSLTPYSSYLLDEVNFSHHTFHDIISIDEFYEIILNYYSEIEKLILKYKEYSFVFRDLAMIMTYEIYIEILFKYLENKKKANYKIVYVTDAISSIDVNTNLSLNNKKYIQECSSIDYVINVDNKNSFFYKINYLRSKIMTIFNKKKIFDKITNLCTKNLKDQIELSYDNKNFRHVYEDINHFELKNKIFSEVINDFVNELKSNLIKNNQMKFISKQYTQILENFREIISKNMNLSSIKIHPFIFLSKNQSYFEVLLYKRNLIPKIFMQHGAYLHENIFLKYNEIYPADVNFVFNDFTKILFENRGAKKVYSVGSVNFNYPITEKEKVYDFLYITYCTSYAYSGVQIFNETNKLSIHSYNIYERHKAIVELFGTKFKDKRICIKTQPGIFTGTMLYVPFLELSKKFKNVTIEFSVPISKLIEQSRYILSDYFSSEFINRDLHYKRDIILFQGSPLALPKKNIEDMKKMFILVDTVDDLEQKIKNIEEITKDRKRYDDIIEYYSSKKCDTKSVVTEILEAELNGR